MGVGGKWGKWVHWERDIQDTVDRTITEAISAVWLKM